MNCSTPYVTSGALAAPGPCYHTTCRLDARSANSFLAQERDLGQATRWLVPTATALGLRVEIASKPPGAKGFVVLPRRWVVERSFGWFGKYRRVADLDYETNPPTSQAVIEACFCPLMPRRLAKS